MVQGLVNAVGSSIVVWSIKLVVSTTSVSPSQCPMESPNQWRTFDGRAAIATRAYTESPFPPFLTADFNP